MDDIYNHLSNNGKFILSEKISGNDDEYLNFKRGNHLTENDIIDKKNALKDVLVPIDEKIYLDIFADQSYKNIEVVDKTYCFRTFVMTK